MAPVWVQPATKPCDSHGASDLHARRKSQSRKALSGEPAGLHVRVWHIQILD